MKRLMKSFAILIALFLFLGTIGIDVLAAASSMQNELSATETITGDKTGETEAEPLEPEPTEPTEPDPTEPEVAEPKATEPAETKPTEPTEPKATEPDPTEPDVTEPSEPEQGTTVPAPTETEPSETEPEQETTVPAPTETEPSETEPEVLKEERPDDPISLEYAEDPAPWMYGSPLRSMSLLSNGTPGTPSTRVVDPNQVAEDQLLPGQVRMTKTAAPVAGLVNTWDITLRVAGRPERVTSDIVVVIDVSGSMGFDIEGMPEDRLYYAKQAAKNFVDTVLGADPLNTRISIVSFSGYNSDGNGNTAKTEHGLSNDAASLKTSINGLSVAGSNTQYTHTQSGIAWARQVLGSSSAAKKTIVLFSDGLPNRNFRINSPIAADFYTGATPSDRLSRKDLVESRFDYNYSVQDNSNVKIGDTWYQYSSPNSAIAEGVIAKNTYTMYTIGMYAGTEGQATLNEIAHPGKAYASDAAGLNTVFQDIAGQLGSPVSTAVITDPMASGFIITDTGTILKTSGNTNYNAGTKTLTWDFPLLSQSGTGDIKYEELTYRIVITEDTPYVTGNTLLPTNGTTAMNFTDVEGKVSVNNFPIPQVDPVFVTLDKALMDSSGSPLSSTKDFTITLDGINYLIKADDPIKVIKKVWNVGNYQVSETAELDYITSYKVNGVTTQQLTLAQAGADQNVVVTNQEKAPEPVDVYLGGMKTLEGRELVDGEFEFNLYESDVNGIQGTLIKTVTNVGNDINFAALSFADGEEGTHYYLVKEAKGMLEGVEYDSRMYLVAIKITDNNQGQLEAQVSYLVLDETEGWTGAQQIVFDNRYINPVLAVDKMVEEDSFSEAGEELHYSFSVTNNGNLAFVKLIVNDAKLGIVDLEIDLSAEPLLPGETYTHVFTAPYIVTDADVDAAAPIVNTLTVVGETEEGFIAEDDDDVTVPLEQTAPLMPPIISLEKLAKESSFANAGDLIHYYFIVTNDGMVPVVKLTVNDPKLGIDNLIIDLTADPLMPGETYKYEFSQAYVVTEADVKAGKVDNTLTVKGENEEGLTHEATDDHRVNREQILPHIPTTGETITYWTGIAALMLGGAFALLLINRRRNLKIQETDEE